MNSATSDVCSDNPIAAISSLRSYPGARGIPEGKPTLSNKNGTILFPYLKKFIVIAKIDFKFN